MPSIDQIRQDYREAVASAIEGSDNLGAWERVRKSLADAIFSAWLIAAAKTAEDIPECELTKMLYAKEGCGAGKEGAGGFQPGNTCAGDGDGQAESGEPSHQTSSPEFKSWFGDSWTLDMDGNPQILYHGTTEDFDEFDIETQKEGMFGGAFYFSEEESVAGSHTILDKAESGQNIMPIYIKLEKPIIIPPSPSPESRPVVNNLTGEWADFTHTSTGEFFDSLSESEDKDLGKYLIWLKKKDEEYFWEFDDSMNEGVVSYDDIWNFFAWRKNPRKRKRIERGYYGQKGSWEDQSDIFTDTHKFYQRLGYDGFVAYDHTNYYTTLYDEESPEGYVTDVAGGQTYGVFDPTQIKSATGNKGDFDPDNPKITHKRTFAKDTFDEMFEMFDMEPTLQAGVNEAALADLEGRIPRVRRVAAKQALSLSNKLAEDIIVEERAGVLPFMESASKGVQAALKKVFWVSDVDHSVVVNIKKLLGDAIRGVMPDDQLQLPEFIKEANLIKAMNLTDARLETIYRTNISTAANEGVMAILRDPEARDLFPLVMITEIKDDRSRPHHAAMDGYITTPGEIDRLKLRPPNGYNCRGSLIKISWDEANDEGWLDDYGNVDMISVRRHNSPEQEGLVAAGIYPDEGFKRGGFFNEV